MIGTFKQRLLRRFVARKLRLGDDIVQIGFFGCLMLVRPKEDVGRNMALGEFETSDLQHFMSQIRNGDVVFDIGANVGAYCVPIGKAFPDARLFAFEPIELNAALIQVSLAVNRLRNVQVVPKCVSDASGTVEFSLAEDSAYSSMLDTRRKSEVEKFQCAATSLNEFCARSESALPDILKIDVEGAELRVLQGASDIFASKVKRPRLVLIELYDQNLSVFGTSIGEVTGLMGRWGYEPYAMIDGAAVPFARRHHNVHYNVFFEARA